MKFSRRYWCMLFLLFFLPQHCVAASEEKTDKYIEKYPYVLNDSTNSLLKKSKITKKITQPDNDIVSQLKDLKDLLDSGVLTKEEFEKAKKKLLN